MFKVKILTKFLLRKFFSGFGLVMLIVCGIIMAITFVERLPSNPTIIDAVYESWIRLIEYIPMFLPLAVFMGTLVATYNITKSSERIIISSAGLSPFQVARPFLIGAFFIGIFATCIINPYSVKLGSETISSKKLKLIDDRIWLRDSYNDEHITITAQNMHKNGDNLIFDNATIYVQKDNFKLNQHIKTDKITLSDDGLHTDKAQIQDLTGKIQQKQWHKKTLITPKVVLDRYLQPDQISFWKLPDFIKKMRKIGIPVQGHLVQFWTLLFLPITMIAMTLLGIAFSQTKQRRNYSFGVKFGLGILTCFILYFSINIFNALGTSGLLPALLAVIAPPLIIIAAAGVFIATFDSI